MTNPFQSTLPVWGATPADFETKGTQAEFQSTLPVWGATSLSCVMERKANNFNPRSPCGERPAGSCYPQKFQFISIHAPRVGSDMRFSVQYVAAGTISIHAPRVGSDWTGRIPRFRIFISIHAPRVGSDPLLRAPFSKVSLFQSTLPVWGATSSAGGRSRVSQDFNPRSPCGERRNHSLTMRAYARFQSTLPVWGATSIKNCPRIFFLFQSTLPVWGATLRGLFICGIYRISIHAPRVGSDIYQKLPPDIFFISIHAPRVGSDPMGFAA